MASPDHKDLKYQKHELLQKNESLLNLVFYIYIQLEMSPLVAIIGIFLGAQSSNELQKHNYLTEYHGGRPIGGCRTAEWMQTADICYIRILYFIHGQNSDPTPVLCDIYIYYFHVAKVYTIN